MKKYVKPWIHIERFELAQHIAACAWDMSNSKDVQNCSAVSDENSDYPPGIMAFYADNVCTDGPIDSFCYTTSSDGMNIFNS